MRLPCATFVVVVKFIDKEANDDEQKAAQQTDAKNHSISL